MEDVFCLKILLFFTVLITLWHNKILHLIMFLSFQCSEVGSFVLNQSPSWATSDLTW